jgi:uncharacterized protein (DUF488 family)
LKPVSANNKTLPEPRLCFAPVILSEIAFAVQCDFPCTASTSRYNWTMSQVPIYTIGYGARDIAHFVEVLKANEIAFLIDVRSKPYSRYKPEFSKAALEETLKTAGIRYVFMGDALGGQPDDPDCYDQNQKINYEKLAQKPYYRAGIGRLRNAWDQQLRVAIMCSEGQPERCHRTHLIAKDLTRQGIDVRHIDEDNQLLTQDMAVSRLYGGQRSLFGADFTRLRSRKRYADEEE